MKSKYKNLNELSNKVFSFLFQITPEEYINFYFIDTETYKGIFNSRENKLNI